MLCQAVTRCGPSRAAGGGRSGCQTASDAAWSKRTCRAVAGRAMQVSTSRRRTPRSRLLRRHEAVDLWPIAVFRPRRNDRSGPALFRMTPKNHDPKRARAEALFHVRDERKADTPIGTQEYHQAQAIQLRNMERLKTLRRAAEAERRVETTKLVGRRRAP